MKDGKKKVIPTICDWVGMRRIEPCLHWKAGGDLTDRVCLGGYANNILMKGSLGKK